MFIKVKLLSNKLNQLSGIAQSTLQFSFFISHDCKCKIKIGHFCHFCKFLYCCRIAKLKNITTDPPEQHHVPHHGKGSVNSEINMKWIDYKGIKRQSIDIKKFQRSTRNYMHKLYACTNPILVQTLQAHHFCVRHKKVYIQNAKNRFVCGKF